MMPSAKNAASRKAWGDTFNTALFLFLRVIGWLMLLVTCNLAIADIINIVVDPDTDLGSVPKLFRPSVMMSWAQPEAVNTFLALPGDLGAVRVTLEPLIQQTSSQEIYNARLAKEATQLIALSKRNAEIFITVARMPSWLASSKDTALASEYGYPLREALPPRNQASYADFVKDTVNILNRQLGLNPWYEFWNEPDLNGFWRGSREQLFTTYGSFVDGARKADANARVGGLCTSGWYQKGPAGNQRKTGNEALLADFLHYVQQRQSSSGKQALDFICWHNYGSHPEQEWWGAREVSQWISQESLKNVPQVVTEWNLWSTFPALLDKQRDTEVGAAYVAATLHAMDRAGIAMQTFAILQDFSPSKTGEPYSGDFGLLTRDPTLEKASFNVFRMLALLESRRISVSVPAQYADAEGLNVIATKRGKKLAILVSRYGNDFPGAFIRSLDRSGYPRGKGINISAAQLDVFAKGENDLDKGETKPAVHDALVKARKMSQLSQKNAQTLHTVELKIAGQPGPFRYSIYLVDAEHGNPAAAYRREITQGHTTAHALASAKAVSFTPLYEGVGKMPQIPMQPYSVALIVAEPAGSK